MTTLTAAKAWSELFGPIKNTDKGHPLNRVHHRDGSAVLMSEEDYDGLIEILQLLSIPGFKGNIRKSMQQMKKGETRSLDEVSVR